MRATARFVLIVITAFVIIIFYVPLGHTDYAGRWGEGTFGIVWSSGPRAVIDDVVPDSPAWKQGIRPGDSITGKAFTTEFMQLFAPHVGDTADVSVTRPNGTKFNAHLKAVPVPNFGAWDRFSGVLAIIPATVFLAVAFALVYLRPNVMTWSFYAFAVGYFSTSPSFKYFVWVLPPGPYITLAFVLTTFFGDFAVLPLLPFVLRFPDGRMTGVRRRYDRAIWVLIGLAFAAYSYEWYKTWSTGYPSPFVDVLNTWLPLATFLLASLIVIKKYKTASAATQQRLGFLVLGLIVSFIAYAIYFVPGIPFAVGQIAGYAVVIMPIAVAYGVLRHRVLDVNFVLNRAIVYGLLSVFVIALVSLLDWLFSQIVSKQHLALAIELLATIAVGFLLDRINNTVRRIVETVFFRHRQIAERYIKRAARALPYATEERAVTDGLVQVPVDALRLSAAALYRRSEDGARFEGVGTSNDTPMAPSGFDGNHLLVRMLRANEERVWLDELRTHLDKDNAAIYVLAIPVTVRHELVSFTLYGAHKNGAQLDPQEVDLLQELAEEASRAYDHIEAVRARDRYAASFTIPTAERA